ncbi:hypothetical protein MRB53_037955 [Persea americana]|nr:hypothetical protein MRB53_037955 [Persea americana]
MNKLVACSSHKPLVMTTPLSAGATAISKTRCRRSELVTRPPSYNCVRHMTAQNPTSFLRFASTSSTSNRQLYNSNISSSLYNSLYLHATIPPQPAVVELLAASSIRTRSMLTVIRDLALNTSAKE